MSNSEKTGGYAGARDRLASRYGMDENDFRRMGAQVMRKLAMFALKQEERETPKGKAGRPRWVGGVLAIMLACCFASLSAHAQINCNANPSPCATITGFLSATNGVAASDFTLTFQPSQMFFVAGTGVSAPISSNCATSHDGSVVGICNPLTTTSASTAFSGTLASGTYFLFYTFYTTSPVAETQTSPEQSIQLASTGQIQVPPPGSGVPSNATGMEVYIGATSGSETLQGSTVGSATFIQSVPLVAGVTFPATNSTACKQVANDAGWPTGTGYQVTLTDQSGNTYPGYPMLWQLLGPGTTINISSGLPYYHGVITFPVPILSAPLNHGPQSISGPLNLAGFNLVNIARLGVGLSLPGYPVDVLGQINSSTGFSIGGTAVNGHCLVGNGTLYVDASCTGALFYQTLSANGIARNQRTIGNFSSRFTLADDPANSRTTIDANPTGSGGLLATAAATGLNGDCAKWTAAGDIGDTGIPCPTGIDQYASSGAGCTTGSSTYSFCNNTVTWPVAFADTSYFVQCTGVTPTDVRANILGVLSKATGSIVVQTVTEGSVAVSYSNIDCHAHHN